MKIYPNDKSAKARYKECLSKYRYRQFAQAISHEDKKSPLETYNPADVIIEPSYKGPHLPQNADGEYIVTQEFMKSLIETYKSEGKLHKKYALLVSNHCTLYKHDI